MAATSMLNTTWSEALTTTLHNRSGDLEDQISKANALLYKLKEKGGWKPASGVSILEELEYAENSTFMYYSGSELLNISPSEIMTCAEYDWKQASVAVSATGLEVDVQNTGKEQVINLLEARIKNAQRTMKNQVCVGMYSDGTGSSGKQIGGLQLLVADDPTTGTVGGINRATSGNEFWRNKIYDFSVETVTASASTIQAAMNTLALRCQQINDKPDLWIMDSVYYTYFWSSLQQIQRVNESKMADAGFQALSFAGADVVYENSTGMPASHAYALNTDFIKLRYAPKRLFKPLDKVSSINQDAMTQLITFAGNLTLSNAQVHGVMHA